MNPTLKAKELINNGQITAEAIKKDTFKCRCCSDKMPTIKVLHIQRKGMSIIQTVKGKRKPFMRRQNFLQEQVDKAVSMIISYIKSNEKLLTALGGSVTKEGIAKLLEVPEHQVKITFHKLNQQGILSQPHNIPPHDSKRDFWGGNDSSWTASSYTIKT